ncbi:MAG: amidohydrolase family protein [Xanthomonadales bacterium]
MKKRTLIAAASLLVTLNGWAETLFIHDATVHTGAVPPVLQDTDVLVRDGRIESIGPNLEAPADARVIEADGRPVTPGLFAGITAHGLVEIGMVEHTVDGSLAASGLPSPGMHPEFDVTPAYNPRSSVIPVTRIEGLTWSVLGAGQDESIIGGQGRPVVFDGGFDSFRGDPVLYVAVGASAAGKSRGSRAAQWMLLEQALAEAGSDLAWTPAPLLTPAGRAALDGFREAGVVVFSADRASDILQVLAFAEKHGLNAVINGAAEGWTVADRIAEAGVPVLLNPLVNLPGNFDQLGARLDNAALLHEAGVTIAFSGHGTHHARKQRQAAGNAVAHGLPWNAALAALTVNPAVIFGLEDRAGTLQPGSPADLVIWSGDPLDVTSAADQVVVGGRMMPMVSRQTLLRDRYLRDDADRPRAYPNASGADPATPR